MPVPAQKKGLFSLLDIALPKKITRNCHSPATDFANGCITALLYSNSSPSPNPTSRRKLADQRNAPSKQAKSAAEHARLKESFKMFDNRPIYRGAYQSTQGTHRQTHAQISPHVPRIFTTECEGCGASGNNGS